MSESCFDPSEAVRFVRQNCDLVPRLGIVLGSGLGECLNDVEVACRISCCEIPGLVGSTALGHSGELVLGRLEGVPVAVMRGRVHVYEGHSFDPVTRGVHLLHALGISRLVLSCAAGGLNLRFACGQMMLIEDHIDLQWSSIPASAGVSVAGRGARSGVGTTDSRLNAELIAAAGSCGLQIVRGVYVAVTGPNYETRAEQRFLAMMADAVGMSTIPEITAANRLGLPVAAVAMITNICNPDQPQETSGNEVIAVATDAAPAFASLLREYVKGIIIGH